VRERLQARVASGLLTPDEIERVTSARVRLLPVGGELSEAFRRCCIAWEVDRPERLTSHRPLVGPLLVLAKRAVRRLLRFQNQAAIARQQEFNRNLLVVLGEVLERLPPRDRRA
jgi:hypothetical protein